MVSNKNAPAEHLCSGSVRNHFWKMYPVATFLFFAMWLVYLWIFIRTPYQLDDWSWGIPFGIEMFLTGGLNGRYVGNLLELIVSRSPALKSVLESLIAVLLLVIPVKTASFEFRCFEKDCRLENRTPQLLVVDLAALAGILFLTIPVSIWRQTYGWIAGFSNYGLASLFLLIYHSLLFTCGKQRESRSVLHRGLILLFGICIQLVLENVTIYVLGVTIIFLIGNWIRTRRVDKTLFLLLGGSIFGAALMFSSSIYRSFMSTGQITGRSLSIPPGGNLFHALLYYYQRFVYYYPNLIWGNNWVVCCVISLLGLFSTKNFQKWRWPFQLFFGGFFLYFPLVHFFGPVENHFHVWNEVYSQYMNLLFFVGMLMALFLFPVSRRKKGILIFLWVSVPAVIVPLIAVKMIYLRYFLMSSAVLIEFSLCLFALGFDENRVRNHILTSVLLFSLAAVSAQRAVIYYQIGEGQKEREAVIRYAQNGEIDRLFFSDLPHDEYLWYNEPLEGTVQETYFREFYQIPDDVKFSNSPIS